MFWKLQPSNYFPLSFQIIEETLGAEIKKTSGKPRIIIVGAGISGISAAARLIDSGFTDIKIFEAENRIGGRVYSVKTGNNNLTYLLIR